MTPFERYFSKLSENYKILEIESTEFKLWRLKESIDYMGDSGYFGNTCVVLSLLYTVNMPLYISHHVLCVGMTSTLCDLLTDNSHWSPWSRSDEQCAVGCHGQNSDSDSSD